MNRELDKQCINAIRVLSADAIEKAQSGHPGLPLGSAAMAFVLWTKMKHNGKNPKWENRDRFVLSAGHGSMLEYSLLHLFGYGLTIEDLKSFRQLGSLTPGHPEYGHTKGVEITTGPLGQGICNAVGMAMAEEHLASKFNREDFKIVDHHSFAIVGDGCLMEGISGEASSLAGTLELGKLIVLYDSNNISIEGNTSIAFREDVAKRYEAYGWQVLKVKDGNDIEIISEAIDKAKAETKKPSIIIVKNQIGYGCPAKQGKAAAHGEPLGAENVKALKENLNWQSNSEFYVPAEVYKNMDKYIGEGLLEESQWRDLFEAYKKAYPELSKEYEAWMGDKTISKGFLDSKEYWSFDKEMASREASGIVLNRLAKEIPNLIGGSADLAPSNKTNMKGFGDFSAEDRSGRNLHFGVREHAMAAITNGLYAHGGLKAFCATFFVFSDYMKGAIRLASLMKLPITYVLTHDSIGVGEDGPTHEPIEQLAALRSMPNMTVFRPADARETAAAWHYAIASKETPTAIVLTRQKLMNYKGSGKNALKGAYTLKEASKEVPDLLLMASGSEVELIYKAALELEEKGISARVISVPSFELFEAQGKEYLEELMPKTVRKRIAVEALTSFGWHRYVGLDGEVISLDSFGASGKAEKLFLKFGFTVENVVSRATKLMDKAYEKNNKYK